MSSTLISNAERLAKNAENHPTIFGSVNLTSIREKVGEILKLIGREGIFREYTLHDSNHIDALLALVDKLIPPDTAKKMKTADWLLIVLSCYFHDLGMLVTKSEFEKRNSNEEFLALKNELLSGDKGKDYEDALEKLTPAERDEFLYQEFVRKNHAKRIFHWIQGQDAPQYGEAKAAVEVVNDLLSGLEQIVRDDLAKICLSHHEEDLFDLDKYQINRVYGDDPQGEANLHYAALLLRTADILQIQKQRVPPVLYKLIDPSNPTSQEEWAKQAGVRAVKPKAPVKGLETDTIEIHASFDKESAYFGLLAYLQQFAAKELARCHDWAEQAEQKGSTFRFPWKQIDWTQVEPRGFEGRSYSFRLDQEKILKLLTGHTLYNDYRVAIREVLQNSIDAVRYRKHLNSNEAIGTIDIIWDSKTRKLTIRDTGVGMTQQTIENFLLNVGSSYYQSEEVLQKHSGFSSISRFGIGVLSTFMIADEVQILTVHPDEEFARRLTLPSVVKSYLIKKVAKGDTAVQAIGPHGTSVTLQVRRSAELKDVEQLVRFWLVLPNCKVRCQTDGADPVLIGFQDAKAVLDYYYRKDKEKKSFKVPFEVHTAAERGVEIAYVVSKPENAAAWDFACVEKEISSVSRAEPDAFLSQAPGMCVEGIRVRNEPAGYHTREYAPWLFANLTGRQAPRTNVARSDIEQTPELDQALLTVYKLLGTHIQIEFDRLVAKGTGIVEAAWEADAIRSWGLENATRSNLAKYEEAMSALRIIAMEDVDACRAITGEELRTLERISTVDSRLVWNIEGVCGTLGINLPAGKIVSLLGKSMKPALPLPRLLGYSKTALGNFDITKIQIYPEERSHRIDLHWQAEKPERWIQLDLEGPLNFAAGRPGAKVWMTRDKDISSECAGYDVVVWRSWVLILATSIVPELLDTLGMNRRFLRYVSLLLQHGEIPVEDQPLLKEQLRESKGKLGEELLFRLTLPFERRLGDNLRNRRTQVNFGEIGGEPWDV